VRYSEWCTPLQPLHPRDWLQRLNGALFESRDKVSVRLTLRSCARHTHRHTQTHTNRQVGTLPTAPVRHSPLHHTALHRTTLHCAATALAPEPLPLPLPIHRFPHFPNIDFSSFSSILDPDAETGTFASGSFSPQPPLGIFPFPTPTFFPSESIASRPTTPRCSEIAPRERPSAPLARQGPGRPRRRPQLLWRSQSCPRRRERRPLLPLPPRLRFALRPVPPSTWNPNLAMFSRLSTDRNRRWTSRKNSFSATMIEPLLMCFQVHWKDRWRDLS
jgi:hypothetical protein